MPESETRIEGGDGQLEGFDTTAECVSPRTAYAAALLDHDNNGAMLATV